MGRVEDVHTVLMHLMCYYFMDGKGGSRVTGP